MRLPAETTKHIILCKILCRDFTGKTYSHNVATIVFNRKILYSLNQTTRCQTFMDIFKIKKRKETNEKKNDTKWNYMV